MGDEPQRNDAVQRLPMTSLQLGSVWSPKGNHGVQVTLIGERSNWLEPFVLWVTKDGLAGETRLRAFKEKFIPVGDNQLRTQLQERARRASDKVTRTAEYRRTDFIKFISELHSFVRHYHRLPSSGGEHVEGEKELNRVLDIHRKMRTRGTLPSWKADLLDRQVPCWHSTREYNWRKQLTVARIIYSARGQLPERDPGHLVEVERQNLEWLNYQRSEHARGRLGSDRVALLNKYLPGWSSQNAKVAA